MNLLNNTLLGQNILLFNHQAGGGHKTVCEAVVQQVNANKGKVIVKDALNDFFGKHIAAIMYASWNNAMKSEDLDKLNRPAKIQPIADFFEKGSLIFLKIATWLLENDIHAVVNPQPAMLYSISTAVLLANQINKLVNKNKNKILIYNILTELPTSYTNNFFSVYKKMGKQNRSVCKLVTIAPICFENKERMAVQDTDFWKKHTGFQINDVIYDELPLRKPFLEAAKIDPKDINNLKVEIKTQAALQLLKESGIVEQDASVGILENKNLENTDVHLMMLGSQAGIKSTLSYVSNFIEMNKMSQKSTKQVVYVFCGDHNTSQKSKSLFEQVCNTVRELKKKEEFPENLEIIPLEGQKADYIAPILRKSKTTITRSGGVTSMELYKIANKDCQIFIHSTQEEVLKGMPIWEGGNAMYLQTTKNARVITRETGLMLMQAVRT